MKPIFLFEFDVQVSLGLNGPSTLKSLEIRLRNMKSLDIMFPSEVNTEGHF